MKTFSKSMYFFAQPSVALILLLSISLGISCKKDDNGPNIDPEDAVYTIGVRTGNVTYLLPVSNLDSGSVSSVGNGTEIAGLEFLTSGKYLYYFTRNEKKFYQYEMLPNGEVKEIASILLTGLIADRAYSQNIINENTLLLLDPVVWGEPEVKWVSIKLPEFVIDKSGSFNLPTQEQAPGVNWKVNLGKCVLHGNKLIMGSVYYDFDGNFSSGIDAFSLDYPSMTNPQRLHSEITSGEMGIFASSNYAKTENGDLYITSSAGAVWGKPSSNSKYGALVRMKSGQTQFDESYLLDFSAILGKPTNIVHLNYVGENIAIAMLFDDAGLTSWGDIENDHYYFAKVNLVTKEVTPYNIPKSGSRGIKTPFVSDGKLYTFYKSVAENKTRILTIDSKGGPGAYKLGATVLGDNVFGYSIARHPSN